ncbi:MAG: FKBP-type peptidyl-prolyl cis-trans isomerase [Parachlamydia sp.]|nr:FKBP-type peptidyl-prolyl cis-trans isomerase [Parachlamydia sp.]
MFNTDRMLAIVTAVACMLAASVSAEEPKTPVQTDAKGDLSQDEIKKISAALGHFLGRNLNTPGINFDLDSVMQGMRDGAAGKPAPMTEKEFEDTMAQLQKRAYEKQAEANLKAANDYLQGNSKQDHVVVVEPGKLQYQVLQEGNGPAVDSHGNPQINYTGKYIDGTVFSTSADLGGPINVPLDQTIPGFSKGISGMKEGEKRRLFIHPDYGYGTMGQLPPNSLLIFDIEVVKAEAPKSSESDDEDLLQLQLDDDESDDDDEHHDHKETKKS